MTDRSNVLSAPCVAWPTLAVLAAALAVWSAGIALAATSPLAAIALATIGAYAAFTPLHEAAHKSLARAGWVNAIARFVVYCLTCDPLYHSDPN